MTETTAEALAQKKCKPCEGGVPPLSPEEAEKLARSVDGWQLDDNRKWIRRRWEVKDFMAGVEFIKRVADIAEGDGHHPDVHLTGFRNVTIELTTHAINGLSENDFIVAAKINELDGV